MINYWLKNNPSATFIQKIVQDGLAAYQAVQLLKTI